MAIVSGLENSYWLQDVPDIVWGSVSTSRQVEFSAESADGAVVSFIEPYTSSADGSVVFRGLSKLLESYVHPLSLVPSMFSGRYSSSQSLRYASFRVTLHYGTVDSPLSNTMSSVVYYASRRMTSSPSGSCQWLSRYHRRKVSGLHPLLACSYIYPDSGSQYRVCWMSSDGVRHLTVVPLSVPSCTEALPRMAFVLCYDLKGLAAAVNEAEGTSECESDGIYLVYADLLISGSIVDTIEWEIDVLPSSLCRLVAFTNCFGMPEVEFFRGYDDRTTSYEGEYSWMDDSYERISVSELTEHRLCAGWVTEDQRSSLRDLAVSPEVYLLHDGIGFCWEQMTVTGVEMSDRRPRTSPQTAYVTLRPSSRRQEVVFCDVHPIGEGVFDATFDATFE